MSKKQIDFKNYLDISVITSPILTQEKHEEIELIYVLIGTIVMKCSGSSYTLHSEDIFVINSEEEHSYSSKKNSNILVACFRFPNSVINSLMNKNQVWFDCKSVNGYTEDVRNLEKTLKSILDIYIEDKANESLKLYSYYFRLLDIMKNKFLMEDKTKVTDILPDESKYDERILMITNYISSKYNTQITLNELSQTLGLSPSYVSRFFKKVFGMNFIEYVNQVRIRHAENDIKRTNNSMLNISLDNGFSSVAIFNKVFKQTYGMTPSVYKKQCQQSKKIVDIEDIEDIYKENQKNLKNFFESEESNTGYFKEKVHVFINQNVKPQGEIKNNWTNAINIGMASDLLKSDIQRTVLQLKEQLHFTYLRFGGVFDEEMYIDVNIKDFNYNFSKINQVLDFMVQNKLKPFIELGQKPKYFHKNGNVTFFREEKPSIIDIETYCRLIDRFMHHIIHRFGTEEICDWYFEIWMNNTEISEKYFHLFEQIYGILKRYDAKTKVGGFGFTIGEIGHDKMEQFIVEWSKRKVTPDFLTMKVYPYDAYSRKESKVNKIKDNVILRHEIDWIQDICNRNHFKYKELIISEWNETLSSRNAINDSCYKAAYMVMNYISCINKADSIVYWPATDSFSEYYDSYKLLNGAGGIITRDQLKKPAFYSMDFMNHMGKYLIKTGNNYMVTQDQDKNYQILCHNFKEYNDEYYEKSEDIDNLIKYGGIFQDLDDIKLLIHLEALKLGKYTVKKYTVNEHEGNLYHNWSKMDFIENVSNDDLKYLEATSQPDLEIKHYYVNEGTLKLEFTISAHEISVIFILLQLE